MPGLRRNLLFESMFDDLGCSINTHKGVRNVTRNGKILIKGVKKNGLYHVVGEPVLNASSEINACMSLDHTKLWHARLGHIGNKGLHYLYKHEFFDQKPSYLTMCENCIFGKHVRSKFQKFVFVAQTPLEYVHADLWGPTQVDTIGGRKYFLSLIDHYSRKIWVYLLKSKSETFEYFKFWKTKVEGQSDFKLKCLRTDNGLEFCNHAFNSFCHEHGIKWHLTVPGTPQQNGTVERMNRTLLEKARCMLISAGMKHSLWGEAVMTASYLINRSPSSAIGFKTPQELWSGTKPNLSHLRPFGCTAFALNNAGKLNSRALKCVMLGYPEGIKGYKLLVIQPGGYRVMTSRDVKFNENEFYFKSLLNSLPENVDRNKSAETHFYTPSPIVDPMEEEFDIGYSPRPLSSENSVENSGNSSLEPSIEHESSTEEYLDVQPHQSGGQVSCSQNSQSSPNLPITSGSPSSSSTPSEYPDVEPCVEPFVEVPNLTDYQLTRDRAPRVRIPNKKYFDNQVEFAFVIADVLNAYTPDLYEHPVKCAHAKNWNIAMKEEIDSMLVNKTWELVPKPANCRTIDCKWVYKLKDAVKSGDQPTYKARLVAKGFTQKEGIDYNDIFAPVVKYKTMRLLLAMAAVYDYEIDQMDVKTAFLHGDLDETIYMRQPKSFVDKTKSNHVCLLRKSIYGLKQSPRQWNLKFDNCMKKTWF